MSEALKKARTLYLTDEEWEAARSALEKIKEGQVLHKDVIDCEPIPLEQTAKEQAATMTSTTKTTTTTTTTLPQLLVYIYISPLRPLC